MLQTLSRDEQTADHDRLGPECPDLARISMERKINAQSIFGGGASTTQMTITYDDFAKLELRVATIVEAKIHPNADKLLVLHVDLGSEKRQICAGIRAYYPPEELVGKQVVVVANLE